MTLTGKAFKKLIMSSAQAAAPIEARCPHVDQCGGCAFQDRPYADQVAAKAAALREVWQDVELPAALEVEPSPNPFEYRTRMDYVATKGRFGLRMGGRFNYIVELETCHLIPPAGFATALRRTFRPRRAQRQVTRLLSKQSGLPGGAGRTHRRCGHAGSDRYSRPVCAPCQPGLECVPRPHARLAARPKADVPFAHPLPCAQFCRVVVQRQFRVLTHPQQAQSLLTRDRDPFIQGRIARRLLEEFVKAPPQPFGFRSRWRVTIAQQAPIIVPIFGQEGRELLFVVRQTRGELFVMPPVVDPAQRDLLGQHGKLRRIVTHQRLHDGQQRRVVRVIGGNRQRIFHPLAPLARQACGGGVQIRLQFDFADRPILRQATEQLLVTGRHAQQAPRSASSALSRSLCGSVRYTV